MAIMGAAPLVLEGEATYTVAHLIEALWLLPEDYRVLLCDAAEYPGTNWTEWVKIECDDDNRVVRLHGRCA